MRYAVKHRTWYAYAQSAPVCHNLAHLAPRQFVRQKCEAFHLRIDPAPASTARRVDYFGNFVDYFTIEQSHNGLEVTAESIVDVAPPPALPPATKPLRWTDEVALAPPPADELLVRQFVLPSSRIVLSAELRGYALASFSPDRALLDGVRDLTRRIHADFAFDPRATTVHTPLSELLRIRRGVCQDFAHLAVGCLRSIGVPARYVSGYLRTVPPPGKPRLAGADASHAWASVYAGPLGWIDFDPTNDQFVGDSHISIAWGRDYDDVCPIQGVFVGGGEHGMGVNVDVVPIEPAL